MKAGVYCRISKDRKVDGGYTMLGVERQEEDCRGLANTLGWEVVEVFVDNDISASTGKRRPAYQRLLKALEAGEVEAIICWHPDRLYRRTQDLESLVEVVERTRAPIATVNAGTVDLTTPSGRLVARLLGATARYEGEHKAERWRRSYEQRRKAGVPPRSGPRLYGYTRDGEVVGHEAEKIREWSRRVLAGESIHALAKEERSAGTLTTLGNLWTTTSLRQTLGNARLAGWVTMRGEIVARSDWPPIITTEESESLRALLSVRKGRKVYPRVATLRGIAKCGVCGSGLMTGRRSANGARSYRCPPVDGYGNGCVDILAEPVEEIVEAYAQERLRDPRIRTELRRLTLEGGGSKVAAEITALETRLMALEAALIESDEEVPQVVRAITEVKERIEAAQRQLGAIAPVHLPAGDLAWPESVERRNALISLVVEAVWVDRSTRRSQFQRDRVRIEPRS